VSPPTLLAHLRLLRLVQSLVIVDDEDLDFLFLIRSEERYLMFLDLLQDKAPPVNTVPLPPLGKSVTHTPCLLSIGPKVMRRSHKEKKNRGETGEREGNEHTTHRIDSNQPNRGIVQVPWNLGGPGSCS